MQNNLCQKWLTIGIIVLFFGLVFGSSASALTIKNKQIVDMLNEISLNSDDYIDITVEETWALLNDTSNGVQIPIDVRTDSEWAIEHINTPAPENPRHHCVCTWDNTTILQEFMSLYEGKEIIIYCRSGSRSVTASNMLVDNGFVGTIYNMLGGINAWKTVEFPTVGNLPPERPIIKGSINGKAGNEYEYTIVSNDPESDDVSYYVDLGDNNTVYVGPYGSGEEITVKHIWEEKETYIISIKSIDYYLYDSDWATLEISMPKNIQTTNNDNNPPNPPEITGPLSGIVRKTYEYQLILTDPDEGDFMFNLEIDFGEGIKYEDCGCGKSWQNGTVLNVSNQWKNVGNYEITARVQDAYGEWSEWSEPLPISMPRNKDQLINSLYLRLSERHPHLFQLVRQFLKL